MIEVEKKTKMLCVASFLRHKIRRCRLVMNEMWINKNMHRIFCFQAREIDKEIESDLIAFANSLL